MPTIKCVLKDLSALDPVGLRMNKEATPGVSNQTTKIETIDQETPLLHRDAVWAEVVTVPVLQPDSSCETKFS